MPILPVVVLGAGVAGLQAIATARRLAGAGYPYDVRPETREQIESLGGKFIDTGVKAEGEGGYARELTEDEKKQQQEELAEYIAKTGATQHMPTLQRGVDALANRVNAGHVHCHVVPRYRNEIGMVEMVSGGSRVLVEDPAETLEKLRAVFPGDGE